MSGFRTLGCAAAVLSALLAAGSVYTAEAQTPAPPAQPRPWPRLIEAGGETLTMYQPQIEQWDDTTMTFRAAIAVQSDADAEPIYGMVRTTAKAEVDKAARIVTLHDFQIVKVAFPTAPERDVSYLAILSRQLPAGAKEISLDRLEAGLAVTQAVKKQHALGVDNDPPRIIFSTGPALLVLVDGDPVLRPVGFEWAMGAARVINTHALIVKAAGGGAFYLTALNYWYAAPAIGGPWQPLAEPPAFLGQVAQAAAGQVDLMQPETDAAPLAAPPAAYVSTVPAELIQTDGEPQFIPIPGTGLLQAQNSDDAIFLQAQTGQYFVLISGRWFASASLDRGPWQFVSARDLPADFARIPADNPRANVLVSVPGTPEAKEALIANCIPQTATVERGPGDVDLTYDGEESGAPQFEPIADLPSLFYASNASLPVVQTAPDAFYCVQNGIWFVAPTPYGPWVVATALPPAIYSIPPSCPVHYVTYCRIYGFSRESVFCGYTPGYLGAIVSADGVVVYGTGYRYRPRIGRVWIAQPCTYGFNAGFACGPNTGFAFGFSEGLFGGGRCEPYWGPYDWGWRHHFNYRHISVNHVDIYEHWKGNVVSIPQHIGHAGAEAGAQAHRQAPFNPYSARPTVLAHSAGVAPSPHEAPVVKPAKPDWSANARPRPQPFTPPHEPAPVAQPAPASKLNNVFVSITGEVYRRTPSPAPEPIHLPSANPDPAERPHMTDSTPRLEPTERPHMTEPAARPSPVPAPHETPAPPPSQPVQWEQRTPQGWQPAAQSPAFRAVAPDLNREAAARDIGQSRAVSQPPPPPSQPSVPIYPNGNPLNPPSGNTPSGHGSPGRR